MRREGKQGISEFPAGVVGACEPEQLVQGCRLEEGACVCGLGCDTVFRFATREQCQAALKVSAGRTGNVGGQVRWENRGQRVELQGIDKNGTGRAYLFIRKGRVDRSGRGRTGNVGEQVEKGRTARKGS